MNAGNLISLSMNTKTRSSHQRWARTTMARLLSIRTWRTMKRGMRVIHLHPRRYCKEMLVSVKPLEWLLRATQNYVGSNLSSRKTHLSLSVFDHQINALPSLAQHPLGDRPRVGRLANEEPNLLHSHQTRTLSPSFATPCTSACAVFRVITYCMLLFVLPITLNLSVVVVVLTNMQPCVDHKA